MKSVQENLTAMDPLRRSSTAPPNLNQKTMPASGGKQVFDKEKCICERCTLSRTTGLPRQNWVKQESPVSLNASFPHVGLWSSFSNFTSRALPTPWASFSIFVSRALPTPYFGSYRRMAKLIDSLARPDRRPGALPSLEGFQMIANLMSRPIPRYPVCYWLWNIKANIQLCFAVWRCWFQWFRKIQSTHIRSNGMCWGRHMREMLGLQIEFSSCEPINTRANGTLPEE